MFFQEHPCRSCFGSQITDPDIMAVAKSWNAELYESLLQVSDAEQDIFCDKNRMSGMWTDKTPLYEAVKGQFHTLLFAGVNTDQCVLGTLVDAYDRGLDCVMLEDCCATRTPGGKEATTWNISVIPPTIPSAFHWSPHIPVYNFRAIGLSLPITSITNYLSREATAL